MDTIRHINRRVSSKPRRLRLINRTIQDPVCELPWSGMKTFKGEAVYNPMTHLFNPLAIRDITYPSMLEYSHIGDKAEGGSIR